MKKILTNAIHIYIKKNAMSMWFVVVVVVVVVVTIIFLYILSHIYKCPRIKLTRISWILCVEKKWKAKNQKKKKHQGM